MKSGGDIMLAVRQKKIADKIIQNGFNLNDFDFKPISNDEFNIFYKLNRTFCLIQSGKQKQGVFETNVYTITPFLNGELRLNFTFEGFDKLVERYETWLRALRENVDIGNPWERFSSFEWLNTTHGFDNFEELFTEEDQVQTHAKLDLILNEVKKLGIENQKIVDDVAYLKEATNRVSKKDWILMFSGVLLSWGLSSISPNDAFQAILTYAGQIMENVKLLKP